MDYILKSARKEHLTTVMDWVQSAEQLELWGGSALSFPPSFEITWIQISADADNSFVLKSKDGGEVLGFAQILDRTPNAHLARIIVAPAMRGKGLGRVLCEQLIQRALAMRPEKITLNVFHHNTAAIALYSSLGFVRVPDQEDQGLVAMVLDPEYGRSDV